MKWNLFGAQVVSGLMKVSIAAASIAALVALGAKTSHAKVSVLIVSSVDGEVATTAAKRAKADQTVKLHAVVAVNKAGKTRYFADVAKFKRGKKTLAARPLDEAPPHYLYWHKVEPEIETMSNTSSGKFRFESIRYAESLLVWQMGKSTIDGDVRPTLTTDRGRGVGTMRFKVSALTVDSVASSPGIEARGPRGSGGVSDSVHRLTVRRDDSYLGFLTELYGQPYIWASAGRTDKSHQSERLEGSDCADFVVYGWRRMGNKVPYTWTGGLPEYAKKLARGTAHEDGVYRDKRGKAIAFPKVGDLVLFPRHVGVLTEDRGQKGVLDHEDIMMHSYFASPREQSLGDSDYASTWIEVRRWK